MLIFVGLILVVVGVIFILLGKLPLGRLPGDIIYERENVKVYVPIATSILLSIVLTLVVNLIVYFLGRK